MELLRDRDARVLLSGETLSMLGDRAMFLALGIWVKTLTGSSADAGLVFFMLALPTLFGPAAGLVVDRVRRRRLMIVTDVTIAAALLPLLLVHSRDRVWLIYVVAAAYGTASILFGSARSALLTEMLPERLLPSANAALQSISESMRLLAPVAGAGLFALLGGGAVAVLDSLTFLASAACLARLRHHDVRPTPGESHFVAQLTAGARHIARTPALRRVVLAVAVALLVVGFAETLIFTVIQVQLHRRPSFFGVLGFAQGVGAVAGGLVAAPALRRLGDARLVAAGMALFAVGDGLLLVPDVAVVLAGIGVAGVGISWAVIGFGTAIQLRTPPDLQGRVYSAADTLVGVPQTFSIALGAVASTVVDFRLLLIVMAVVTAGCGAVLAVRGEADRPPADYTPPDAQLAQPLGADDGGEPRPAGGVRADGAGERVHPRPE